MPNTLSVVLIAKNEEELIGQCLKSLEPLKAYETVVVDTGSTDSTVEIARSYGAKIGHFEWCDHFSKARSYAESLCTGTYVYWQDADEILIEGHDLIREIVKEGTRDGIKPKLIFSRASDGAVENAYLRQELLHKNNGTWRWEGAAHNYTTGGKSEDEPRIVVEHLSRPSGDRPNVTDMFESLRANLGKEFSERHLFYLMRQHYYDAHYQETIALAKVLLEGRVEWSLQRSDAAIYVGKSYEALGNVHKARAAYMRALQEDDRWAEPYFFLGQLYYRQGKWVKAIAWLSASLAFEPVLDYFSEISLYDWKRHDLLAVCCYKVGKYQDALNLGQYVLDKKPNDERLQKNMEYYRDACNAALST